MIKIKVDSENTNMLTKAYSKIDHEKEEKHKWTKYEMKKRQPQIKQKFLKSYKRIIMNNYTPINFTT